MDVLDGTGHGGMAGASSGKKSLHLCLGNIWKLSHTSVFISLHVLARNTRFSSISVTEIAPVTTQALARIA